jgi:LysR family transcriptional activator of nhaA
MMEWLNYHHLLYFYVVAREGGVAKASKVLRVAPPTISGQIRLLEESLNEKLFAREGRGLVLTEVGRTVYQYADEIFSVGRELLDTIRGRPTGRPQRLVVGVADALPKLVAHNLIRPALGLADPIRLVVREGTHERLLTELASGAVDVVLSDAPVGPPTRIKAFNHGLGECGTTFVAASKIASTLNDEFPKCLDGTPMLVPGEGTGGRRALDAWLDAHSLRPVIAGEFDDSALLKVFGAEGIGVFAIPTAIERSVCKQFNVEVVGRVPTLRARFFAITVERRVKHPAVVAICTMAKDRLFA